MIWKDYFDHLYNVDTQEIAGAHMCGFDDIQRDTYFGGESTKRTEVEIRDND